MAASVADAGFVPPAVADTYSTIGLSLPLAIARLLGREPDDQVHWLTQRHKENFVTMRQAADFNEPLHEGILPLRAELGGRDDLRSALWTGKSRRGVRSVFERHGIGHYFTVARTADDCPSKPHPAMVLESCAEMGIEPSRTIVIGDAIYDMQMARSAGAAWPQAFRGVITSQARADGGWRPSYPGKAFRSSCSIAGNGRILSLASFEICDTGLDNSCVTF